MIDVDQPGTGQHRDIGGCRRRDIRVPRKIWQERITTLGRGRGVGN
jgi:hypothetical protein